MSSSIKCIDEEKIVTIKPDFLYHTTIINDGTEKVISNLKENATYGVPIPLEGQFNSSLHPEKYFTITDKCNYASPWITENWAYLRYPVLKPMRLLDVRGKSNWFYPTLSKVKKLGVDGYIETDDCIEVFLLKPADFLSEEFEKIQLNNEDHSIEDEVKFLNIIDNEE